MIASGALLLAGVGLVVPMMGMVAGVAVMLGASLDRLKLRVDALEKVPRVAVAVKFLHVWGAGRVVGCSLVQRAGRCVVGKFSLDRAGYLPLAAPARGGRRPR